MNFSKKTRIIGLLTTMLVALLFPSTDILAAWNTPSCDPDAAGGPTDPSCNVSAPLNVADVDQTKVGQLTIQNALNARSLQIGGAIPGGNGNVYIDTLTGIGISLEHNATNNYAIYAQADSNMVYTDPAFYFRQEGSGTALGVYADSGLAFGATNNTSAFGVGFATPTEAIQADGPSDLQGDVTIVGATDITGDTSVTGNTDLTGNVDITGPTDMTTANGDGAAINIHHRDSSSIGINLEASSSSEAMYIMNDDTGEGLSVWTDTGDAVTAYNNDTGYLAVLGGNNLAAYLQGPGSIGMPGIEIISGDALAIYVNGSGTDGIYIDGTSEANGINIKTVGTNTVGITVDADEGYAGQLISSMGASGVKATFMVENDSDGTAIEAIAGSISSAIPVPGAAFPAIGSEGVRGKSASSYGVVGYSESTAANGAGVYGAGVNDIGVLAHSDANYGFYSNTEAAATYYGGLLCNQETNCAYLGGPTLAGLFEYRVKAEASVPANSIVEVNNTNTSTSPGYGLVATTSSGSWSPAAADQGTAVVGYGYDGQGVYGLSDQSFGVQGISNNNSGVFGESRVLNTAGVEGEGPYGVMGKATGAMAQAGVFGDAGTGTYGVQGVGAGGGDIGVLGEATTGNAGRFITSGPTGTTLLAQSIDTGNAIKVGIQVEAQGTGATGIDVDVANNGKGININVDEYSSSLNANGGYVQGYAAFNGGQFYPNENAGNGVFGASWLDNGSVALGVGGSSSAMLFDGSDVWILHSNGRIYRRNAVDMRNVLSYDVTENTCRTMSLRDDTIYLPCGGGTVRSVNLYNDTVGTASVGVLPGLPLSSVFDKYSRLWIGLNSGNIGYIDLAAGVYVNVVGGYGNIVDMTVSDGFIWAVDQSGNKIVQIDYNTLTVVANITSSEFASPSSIIYDGAYIWATSTNNDRLIRINQKSKAIKTYVLTNAIMTGPTDLVFDDSRIWMIFKGNAGVNYGWGEFVVSKETFYPLGYGVAAPSRMLFDGTYIWTVDSGGNVDRDAVGTGFGHAATNVTRGFYIYGYDGQLHCVYIDSGGNLNADINLALCDW